MSEEEQTVVETEPIIAYRTWDINYGKLNAVGVRTSWEPMRRMIALCQRENYTWPDREAPRHGLRSAPVDWCECGVYGFKDLGLVVDHLVEIPPFMYSNRIAGRVALWGRVIECEKGYRAEHAYPQTLYYTSDNEGLVRRISQVYGVDAVPMPDELVALMYEEKRRRAQHQEMLNQMIAAALKIPVSAPIGPAKKRENKPWDWRHDLVGQIGFLLVTPFHRWILCKCGHLGSAHGGSGCLVKTDPTAAFGYCDCYELERRDG